MLSTDIRAAGLPGARGRDGYHRPMLAKVRWAHLVPRAVLLMRRMGGPVAVPPVRTAGRRAPVNTVVGAVRRASHVTRSTCLTRSVALCTLLRRYGYRAELVIAAVEPPARVDDAVAHAWVELDGRRLGEDGRRAGPAGVQLVRFGA